MTQEDILSLLVVWVGTVLAVVIGGSLEKAVCAAFRAFRHQPPPFGWDSTELPPDYASRFCATCGREQKPFDGQTGVTSCRTD